MSIIRILFLSLFFTGFSFYSFSQIEVGEWREHFSYKNTTFVTDAGDKVYVAGELGLFSFDKEEGSLETFSKVNGLSDAEINTIAYNKYNNTLIIAYKNSNIDILKGDIVYNISEIKRKQISHSKTINKIYFSGEIAYLSCGFGIVVLNTNKYEITDTFYIGDNASYKNINDVCLFGTKIYAATDKGLYYADKTNSNLSDYKSWYLENTIPDSLFKISYLNSFNGKLFVAQENETSLENTIYHLENNNWQIFKSNISFFRTINSTENNIVITSANYTSAFDKGLGLVAEIKNYNFSEEKTDVSKNMTCAIFDGNSFYISDKYNGLVYGLQNKLHFILPNGPINNTTAKSKIVNNKLITTNGNNTASKWHSPIYNIFENEEWKTFQITRDTAVNFFSIAVHPNNPDNIFIGTWGYGVFQFSNNEWVDNFHNLNSSLRPYTGYGYGFIRISALEFDNNNNLWVLNQHTESPISVKNSDNEWVSYNFDGLITEYSPDEILVTEDNNKWFLLGEGKGILVLDDNATPLDKGDDTYKKLTPTESNGEIISSTVTAIEQDKTGNIWVGTTDGVAIYYNPSNVFENDFFADRVQLTSYGNDTTEQYLFKTDVVTDIETDGANRKWIATQNSGVFLLSENGKEEIVNYNIFNSPLVSNTINDISINHKTGEVFILTDKGILSYRSDATEGGDEFGEVYVFPNPIRPNYSGKITVTGLVEDVNVKFTDLSGNVVFETTALGGQAIWDGKTFDGRKVSSGIYLVFCTNEDGSKTQVSKLLFMN